MFYGAAMSIARKQRKAERPAPNPPPPWRALNSESFREQASNAEHEYAANAATGNRMGALARIITSRSNAV
jgi:hypothetical protein